MGAYVLFFVAYLGSLCVLCIMNFRMTTPIWLSMVILDDPCLLKLQRHRLSHQHKDLTEAVERGLTSFDIVEEQVNCRIICAVLYKFT